MGYQACLYNPVSYPNRAPTQLELVTQHRKTSEKLPGKSRGNIDRNKRDTLHGAVANPGANEAEVNGPVVQGDPGGH